MLKRTFIVYILCPLTLIITLTGSVFSEVSPEIQLGARGVMSINTDIRSEKTTSAINDFSDTDLMLGFRQKLYSNFRTQLVIGFQFPDADSDLGQIYFHQTFIKIQDKSNIFKIGRSQVENILFDFPTLRDDDALLLTHVLNPFSAGINSEDHQFGNVLEYAHIFNQRYFFRIHAEHFRETPEIPGIAETDFGINAVGFLLQYYVPETQRWNRPIIQSAGIGINSFLTERPGFSNEYDKALKNILAGFVVNIRRDPVNFWDLRSQMIYNIGFDEIRSINVFEDLTRAEAITSYMSIRFLYRKLERPTFQMALSGGYKKFLNTTETSYLFHIAGNVFYRLGENFDMGIQIQYNGYYGDLKSLFGNNEARIQFSFIYSIDQSWNNQFDDRESLLNLEHGYIP